MSLLTTTVKNLVVAAALSIMCFFSAYTVAAEGEGTDKACVDELAIDEFGLLEGTEDASSSDEALVALMERYELKDMLSADPEKNLAVLHPSIVMSGPQRAYAIVESAGSKVENLHLHGETRVFNIFSNPNELNGGSIIVGHETEIETVVESLKDAAFRGERKIPFLLGPHGTGKTLFQTILGKALRNVTAKDPKNYYLTFEWKNLDDIEVLDAVFDGGRFKSESHESPFALLPAKVQDKLLALVTKHNKELAETVGGFNPVSELGAQNAEIRDAIVEHYTEQMKRPLTEKEILQFLVKHVDIRRMVLGTKSTLPIIDAQGEEPNQGELFLQRNPKYIQDFEASNALGWSYGAVIRANGSILFLDEFPRNMKGLRDKFLRVFESGEVSEAGMTIPVDAWILGAGNHESLDNMIEGGDARAQADRLLAINFGWHVTPHEVAKTLLFMYGDVYSQELGTNKKIVKANPVDMFPRTLKGEKPKGTDGRYDLYLGSGKERVHVSPHALMLLANTVAATRITFDPKKAMEKAANITNYNAIYQHPVERMRYFNGEIKLTQGGDQELEETSILTNEGQFGLSYRDATAILAHAANIARREGGELSTNIMRRAFENSLIGKDGAPKVALFSEVFNSEDEIRGWWSKFSSMMAQQITLPKLREDLMSVLAQSDERVNQEYDVIMNEIVAVSNGEKEYTDNSGDRVEVKADRLQAVLEIYKDLHKVALDINQVATFAQFTMGGSFAGEVQREGKLLSAITHYYAKKSLEVVDLADLAKQAKDGSGNALIDEKLKDVAEGLKAKGYTMAGVKSALALVEALEREVAQVKKQQQQQ